MKKKLISWTLMMLLMMGIMATAYAESDGDANAQRALIVYFTVPEADGTDAVAGASRVVQDGAVTGNTKYIADAIVRATNGDAFAIETVQIYPDSHAELLDFAEEELNQAARPELSSQLDNLDDYDVVFLGYPIWYADLPMPLYTFLDTYDFSGKTIIPFCPHGGSGFAGTVDTIRRLEPGATVSDGGFSISRDDVPGSAEEVITWVQGFELGVQ